MEDYAGHWVCVAEQRIVAADCDRRRLGERGRAGGWHGAGRAPYVCYVPAGDEGDVVAIPTPFLVPPQ